MVSRRSITCMYLVRHGMTDWNRIGRLQGRRDTPLNATGLRQANELGRRFHATALPRVAREPVPRRVTRVIASPLSRARTTAVIVSRHLAVPLETDERLIELDHGSWTGRTIAEIARRHPDAADLRGQLQGDAPAAVRAETLTSVYHRASSLMTHLLNAYAGQSIVVVGHGVTNALLSSVAMHGSDTPYACVASTPNTGGIVMTFQGRHLAAHRTIGVEGSL